MQYGYKPLSLDSHVFLSFSDHALQRMDEQGTSVQEVISYLKSATMFTATGARDLNLDDEARSLLRCPSDNPRAVALSEVPTTERFSLHYYSHVKGEQVDIPEVRWHISIIEFKGNAMFTVVTDFFTDSDIDKKGTMGGVVPPFSKFKSLVNHARAGRVKVASNTQVKEEYK